MAAHEFEDIVEFSIQCLDKSERKDLDFRSLFYTLYEFQNNWDTGFTNFRVIDILLNYHYTYMFLLNEHPDYLVYKDYFESITKEDFVSLLQIPTEEYSKENYWSGGYCRDGYLYVDVNTPLWKKMIEIGKLKGEDAKAAEKLDLVKIIRTLVEEGVKQKDRQLLQMWYALFTTTIAFESSEYIKNLHLNADAIFIRNTIAHYQAFDLENTYGANELPTKENIETNFTDWGFEDNDPTLVFFKWWYEPLKAYYLFLENTPQYWNNKAVKFIKLASTKLPTYLNEEQKEIFKENIKKHIKEANICLDKALSLNAELDFLWLNKSLTTNGDHQKSVEFLDKAISINDKNDTAYAYRGYAQKLLGNLNEAKQDYEKALSLNPANEFAKYYLQNLK